MFNKISDWRSEFALRQKYSVPSRKPFFELAESSLPKSLDAVVLDIGAGDGSFASSVLKNLQLNNFYLLDHNQSSVNTLAKKFPACKTLLYAAPESLPFKDNTVAYIHLSHIVEHLEYHDLYKFLEECDRVIVSDGVLVISTPLLWERFYDDMSHIKPYNPSVFINYLCDGRENASAAIISRKFNLEQLVYRYRVLEQNEFGSRYFILDVFIRIARIILSKLGFRNYTKNGYTLILRKVR